MAERSIGRTAGPGRWPNQLLPEGAAAVAAGTVDDVALFDAVTWMGFYVEPRGAPADASLRTGIIVHSSAADRPDDFQITPTKLETSVWHLRLWDSGRRRARIWPRGRGAHDSDRAEWKGWRSEKSFWDDLWRVLTEDSDECAEMRSRLAPLGVGTGWSGQRVDADTGFWDGNAFAEVTTASSTPVLLSARSDGSAQVSVTAEIRALLHQGREATVLWFGGEPSNGYGQEPSNARGRGLVTVRDSSHDSVQYQRPYEALRVRLGDDMDTVELGGIGGRGLRSTAIIEHRQQNVRTFTLSRHPHGRCVAEVIRQRVAQMKRINRKGDYHIAIYRFGCVVLNNPLQAVHSGNGTMPITNVTRAENDRRSARFHFSVVFAGNWPPVSGFPIEALENDTSSLNPPALQKLFRRAVKSFREGVSDDTPLWVTSHRAYAQSRTDPGQAIWRLVVRPVVDGRTELKLKIDPWDFSIDSNVMPQGSRPLPREWDDVGAYWYEDARKLRPVPLVPQLSCGPADLNMEPLSEPGRPWPIRLTVELVPKLPVHLTLIWRQRLIPEGPEETVRQSLPREGRFPWALDTNKLSQCLSLRGGDAPYHMSHSLKGGVTEHEDGVWRGVWVCDIDLPAGEFTVNLAPDNLWGTLREDLPTDRFRHGRDVLKPLGPLPRPAHPVEASTLTFTVSEDGQVTVGGSEVEP